MDDQFEKMLAKDLTTGVHLSEERTTRNILQLPIFIRRLK